jgi:uncharacterized membrane-anchored protein
MSEPIITRPGEVGASPGRGPFAGHILASKVPAITALFWVVKVLTTGMGEAASDFLGNTNLVLAGVVGVGGLVLALWLQLRTERYLAAIYWFAVVMVAVFGTMAADLLHIVGIPYTVTTPFYAVALAVILYLWHRSEGTLSIHSIVTPRREIYYWITVLATFALGTAAGDLTATNFHLGFFWSGVMFAGAIVVPAVAWRLGANAVLCFWAAYVLTRPLGASFADWFGKPPRIGGLDYGDGTVTGLATIAIVILVAYFAFTRRDVQPDELHAQRVGADGEELGRVALPAVEG